MTPFYISIEDSEADDLERRGPFYCVEARLNEGGKGKKTKENMVGVMREGVGTNGINTTCHSCHNRRKYS